MTRAVLALLALFASASSFGQAFDIYGFNPRATASGGTQSAAEGDFTAVFYNPALLLGTDRPSVGAGFSFMKPYTYTKVTQEFPGGEALTYQAPTDYSAVTIGANAPLGGKLGHRVALGLGLSIPTAYVYKGTLIDSGLPYFYRYDSSPARIQILGALAVRPLDWISLGLGAQVQSNFVGSADFQAQVVPNGSSRITQRALVNEVKGVVAPNAGVAVLPFDWLHVYAAWRGELKANYTLPISVDLEEATGAGQITTLDTLGISTNGVTYFTPHVVSAGARVKPTSALILGVDLSFEMWSRAPPPPVSLDVTFQATFAQVLGTKCMTSRVVTFPAPPGQLCPPGNEAPVGFQDIWVPRFGAEYQVTEHGVVRAGYFYRPSPIPPQSALNTNLLDPAQHVVSVGGGYSFPDPLELAEHLVLDAAAQVGFFVPQGVVKTRPNRLPDYRAGGATLNLTLSARYEF